MIVFSWFITIIVSALVGISFIKFLTCHPLQMNGYLLATISLLMVDGLVVTIGLSGSHQYIAILVTTGSGLIGYFWMAKRVLSRDDPQPVPVIQREENSPGKDHMAVVYFTHGEPETYDPIGWINQFKEFDKQRIKFVPLVARPFFLYQLRKGYLRIGKSDHRQMHHNMLRSLEKAYRDEGDLTTRFYISFLDDHPRPDAAVIQAINDGANRIIVSEVFLTISNHTAEGEELIEALEVVDKYGIPVQFTGPLYNSETLKSMFVERVNANNGVADKSKVGVLLVGHGQPDEWDLQWPTETEQEIGFREGVLKKLEQDGYLEKNLGLAWMEFKQPKPALKVAEMVQNGVKEIMYFSAAISADSMHSQYDIPVLVEKAKVPDDVRLKNLGAWNNDPIVIKAIKEKIDLKMFSPP